MCREVGVDIRELLAILLISFVSPLAGIIISFIVIMSQRQTSGSSLTLFIVALVFFISWINSTKIASSDTLYYLEWYADIDRSDPLKSFLNYRGQGLHEPLFSLISIIFNYITGGSLKGYLFLSTFFVYYLQCIAIVNVSRAIGVSEKIVVAIITAVVFCNPLFIQSVHAIRQMMAVALLMLAISKRVLNGRNNWWLLLAALLMHTSVIIFLPLVVLPIAYKSLSFFRFVLLLALSWVLINAYQYVIPLFQTLGVDYLNELSVHASDAFKNNEMTLGYRGFLIYNIPYAFLAVLSLVRGGWDSGQLVVYYILYFSILGIVLLNPVSTEFSIRYGFYIWSVFPYCLIAYSRTSRYADIILPALAILNISIFLYLLAGDSSFPSLWILLFRPLPFLVI